MPHQENYVFYNPEVLAQDLFYFAMAEYLEYLFKILLFFAGPAVFIHTLLRKEYKYEQEKMTFLHSSDIISGDRNQHKAILE